jgi:hypothetical protein
MDAAFIWNGERYDVTVALKGVVLEVGPRRFHSNFKPAAKVHWTSAEIDPPIDGFDLSRVNWQNDWWFEMHLERTSAIECLAELA